MLEEEIITEKRRTLPTERTSELHIIDTINFTSLILIVVFLGLFLYSRVFRDVATSIGKVEKVEYAYLSDSYNNFPLHMELILTEVGKNFRDVKLFVTPIFKEGQYKAAATIPFDYKNTFTGFNKKVESVKQSFERKINLTLNEKEIKTAPVNILSIPSADSFDEISCQFAILTKIPGLDALEIKWRYFTSNVEVNLLLANLVLFVALIYAFINYYKNTFHIDDDFSLTTYIMLNFVALFAAFPWQYLFQADFVPKLRMISATVLASTLRFVSIAQLSSASASTGQMPFKLMLIAAAYYIVRAVAISYFQICGLSISTVGYVLHAIELVCTIVFIVMALKASVSLSLRKVVFFGGLLFICILASFTIEESWITDVEDFADTTSSNNYMSFYLVATIFVLFILQLDNDGKYSAMNQLDLVPSFIHQEDNNTLIADKNSADDDVIDEEYSTDE